MKDKITIDIETYSDRNIKEVGLFKYVESPSFEILIFGYSINSNPRIVIDLARGERIPKDIVSILTDDNWIKIAHNTFFEFVCLRTIYPGLKIEQWKDTMILAYTLGMPGSLEKIGPILKLNTIKQDTGKALIKYFSTPCLPSKANCYRTRNLPEHDIDRWNLYLTYNGYDVGSEDEAYSKLINLPYAEYKDLWDEWAIDFRINDAGVNIDTTFVENATQFGENYKNELTEEMIRITGVDNPNSNEQIKKWISNQLGYTVSTIAKGTEIDSDNVIVQRVLTIRNELQKTSLAKYETMLACQCEDGRARGLLQFYGASTGRWAGRLIQVQNLPKNKMKGLAEARDIVRRGDYDMFKILYDKPNDVLSELIRTSFIPSLGNKFIVADYSAIEARVIAWLAQEKWAMEVFSGDGKIYEATASQMFKVDIKEVTKELRAKGKIATLALGYQGSVGALTAMGAIKMGIEEHELEDIVKRWRNANPHIVQLWSDVQNSAILAIQNAGETYGLPSNKNVKFKKTGGILYIFLPSGRILKYAKARVAVDSTGRSRLKYMGVRQLEGASKQWCEVDTFGGKITENIVQAIARDCLMNSIKALYSLGYDINFHVHDEVIIDAPRDLKVETITNIMGEPIDWAPGLDLRAAGYECDFYMKD